MHSKLFFPPHYHEPHLLGGKLEPNFQSRHLAIAAEVFQDF